MVAAAIPVAIPQTAQLYAAARKDITLAAIKRLVKVTYLPYPLIFVGVYASIYGFANLSHSFSSSLSLSLSSSPLHPSLLSNSILLFFFTHSLVYLSVFRHG